MSVTREKSQLMSASEIDRTLVRLAHEILERSSDGKDHVKILDFGVAGIQGETGSAHVPLTETGKMLGTPWYMSPEQCFGQPADCRTDIYQLGCLFYELLTAGKPFEGSTAFDIEVANLCYAAKERKQGISSFVARKSEQS